jgi:hypothetical protein
MIEGQHSTDTSCFAQLNLIFRPFRKYAKPMGALPQSLRPGQFDELTLAPIDGGAAALRG